MIGSSHHMIWHPQTTKLINYQNIQHIQRWRNSKTSHNSKQSHIVNDQRHPRHRHQRSSTFRATMQTDSGETLSIKGRSNMDMGVCRPSKSPYASPLHMVRKPTVEWGRCGDYRACVYPLPHIQDCTHVIYEPTKT